MDVLPGEQPASLQTQLEPAKHLVRREPLKPERRAELADPARLILELESSKRFHRDSRLGRIYHRRSVSFRENQPSDSLHIAVQGNRLAAHVDRVSPLGERRAGPTRYSFRRAVSHNLAGMAHDLFRLLRGRQGDHRCELNCEWLWDPSEAVVDDADLLDPRASAWSVQLEARVAGQLDEQRLRAALGSVLAKRPFPADGLDLIECPDDSSLDAARAGLQSKVVSPAEWPPLRARLARHPQGDILMLNLNHAAADGFGAMRVLDCIADAYAGKGAPEPLLDFLATRDVPARPASAPVSAVRRGFRASVEWLRDALSRPARLAPEGAESEAGYGFHLVRLSEADTRRVMSIERPGTSRNVLMAALHLAIGQWNLEHGAPGRQVGVLVPVNLRPEDWSKEKIGNFSVTARVSTRRHHRSDPASALKVITAQTTRNKQTRSGIALISALERAGLLPLWAKQSLVVLQPLTGNRKVDTAMLSHLGWLQEPPSFGPEAGEAVELWFSVPARAPQALCMGAVTVAGCLHLTFRYPKRLFSPDAMRRFAQTYIDTVRHVADERQ